MRTVTRIVRSLQMFLRDGSFTETANTFLRGASVGSWNRASGPNVQRHVLVLPL
jgi:hypothetical protein